MTNLFTPILTYHDNRKNIDSEFIAILEGTKYPIWGISFSVQKVQFNIDLSLQPLIDHSRAAVREARRIANFFVDEARLSGAKFTNVKDEQASLIQAFDTEII